MCKHRCWILHDVLVDYKVAYKRISCKVCGADLGYLDLTHESQLYDVQGKPTNHTLHIMDSHYNEIGHNEWEMHTTGGLEAFTLFCQCGEYVGAFYTWMLPGVWTK